MGARTLTKLQARVARKACREAIDKIGGPKKVAALFPPMKPQAVSQWDVVPLPRVPLVHEESGVELERLAPDMYRRAKPRPEREGVHAA